MSSQIHVLRPSRERSKTTSPLPSSEIMELSNYLRLRSRYSYDGDDAFGCGTLICRSCGHRSWDVPAGVKFDPSDEQILEHLEAKLKRSLHPLIDQFIPTLEGEHGICYTHPQNLPGNNPNS